jgi:hypothetical protein
VLQVCCKGPSRHRRKPLETNGFVGRLLEATGRYRPQRRQVIGLQGFAGGIAPLPPKERSVGRVTLTYRFVRGLEFQHFAVAILLQGLSGKR